MVNFYVKQLETTVTDTINNFTTTTNVTGHRNLY